LGGRTLPDWKWAPHPLLGFYVRAVGKGHGTKALIEGNKDLTNLHTCIIEDVTTTGASAMLAATVARQAGAKVNQVLSVVDREAGAAERFAKEGIKFKSLFTLNQIIQGR